MATDPDRRSLSVRLPPVAAIPWQITWYSSRHDIAVPAQLVSRTQPSLATPTGLQGYRPYVMNDKTALPATTQGVVRTASAEDEAVNDPNRIAADGRDRAGHFCLVPRSVQAFGLDAVTKRITSTLGALERDRRRHDARRRHEYRDRCSADAKVSTFHGRPEATHDSRWRVTLHNVGDCHPWSSC